MGLFSRKDATDDAPPIAGAPPHPALERSLLVVVDYGGSNARPHLALTRRGRRALESGVPERWIDLPADPA